MMQGRLRYLYRDRDRHGNERLYVCRPGRRKVRIREEYGSQAFWNAYTAAVGGEGERTPTKGREGSLRSLVQRYYQSAEFRQELSERTRYVRRGILERICDRDGDKPYRLLEPRHIHKRRDEVADRPEAANAYVKALRQLFAWAIKPTIALAERNPARDVPYIRTGSGGFHTWTREEVGRFMERHPVGAKAHLALALLLYTGVRRSDAVTLGRQMIRDGWLHFTEAKGSRRLKKDRAIPVLPALRAVIDATKLGNLTFLVTAFDKPFTANGFGNWFRKRCNEAGLPHCSAHGLRKAGATIAAENGATEHELMAIYGWESPKQAALYTRKANRRKLAGSGMDHLRLDEPGTEKSPTSGSVGEKGQKVQ
jgi:integrase